MKVNQFSNQLDVAMDQDSQNTDVRVIDADGFQHEVQGIFYDPEAECIYIRTAWKADE